MQAISGNTPAVWDAFVITQVRARHPYSWAESDDCNFFSCEGEEGILHFKEASLVNQGSSLC